jgi:hypothetical protein
LCCHNRFGRQNPLSFDITQKNTQQMADNRKNRRNTQLNLGNKTNTPRTFYITWTLFYDTALSTDESEDQT